jgi:very-short-patch-repair endonuclease
MTPCLAMWRCAVVWRYRKLRSVVFAKRMRREQTPAEQELWEMLRKRQLDGWRFRRQAVFGAFIVDFYCPEAEVVVEVDGSIHRTQRGYDAWRQRLIERRHGVRFVRITNGLIRWNKAAVVRKLRAAPGGVSPRASQRRCRPRGPC